MLKFQKIPIFSILFWVIILLAGLEESCVGKVIRTEYGYQDSHEKNSVISPLARSTDSQQRTLAEIEGDDIQFALFTRLTSCFIFETKVVPNLLGI